jgi:hypothetical protein
LKAETGPAGVSSGNDVIQHGDDQQSVIARPRTVQGRMGGSPVSDQRKG